jgi:hypothetical protein
MNAPHGSDCGLRADALRHVVGALAGAKLDDATIGEAALAKRILAHDRFDFFATLTERQNDAPLTRDLSPGDQKVPGRVVLLGLIDLVPLLRKSMEQKPERAEAHAHSGRNAHTASANGRSKTKGAPRRTRPPRKSPARKTA